VYHDENKHGAFFRIMLTNVWIMFSETPAYFGFLEFVYSNDVDKNANDDDKNDHLSMVSHSDHCDSFIKSIINDLLNRANSSFISELE
jgi:hypothetical protein